MAEKNRAFWLSALTGAYLGISILLVSTALSSPPNLAELWVAPILVAAYGTFALPFVALGLAMFGLPITYLLKNWAQEWWTLIVAIIWAAVAGRILMFSIDHLLFFGHYNFEQFSLDDPALFFSVPAAVTWWTLYRRILKHGEPSTPIH